MRAYMAQRRADRRQKLIDLFGGMCQVCGSGDNLEFDHIDGSTREFQLSGYHLDKSWNMILEEAKKCQLLCKAHHREKTNANGEQGGGWNLILDPKHGTAHMYLEHKCRCIDCKYARSLHRKGELGYNVVTSAPSTYKGKRGRPFPGSSVGR